MNRICFLFKQAYSTLKSKPAFALSIALTMGISLSALLCVLTLAYVMLLKPLPYPDQSRLFKVDAVRINPQGQDAAPAFNYPSMVHLYNNQTVFEQAALIEYSSDILTTLPEQPRLQTAFTTPEWFSILDIPMHLGRRFSHGEAKDRQHPVAILSYETWQTEFSGAADILEHKVSFKGIHYRIVGVTAQSFIEPKIFYNKQNTQIWLPWDFNPTPIEARNYWTSFKSSLYFIGKLNKEYSPEQANHIISALVSQQWLSHVAGVDFVKGWNLKTDMPSLKSAILGDSQSTVYLLIAASVGLLLIAASNLFNLFISHTAQQQHRLVIQAALGANRKQLFQHLLAESSLLMGLSILSALAFAAIGFNLLQYYLAELLPRSDELSMQAATVLAALLIGSVMAWLFARLNAVTVNYHALNRSLMTGSKGVANQVGRRIRQYLIGSQIAVATVLIMVNIVLFKQALTTITQPMGIEIENLADLSLSLVNQNQADPGETKSLIDEFQRHLLQLPQVESLSRSPAHLSRFNGRMLRVMGESERHMSRLKEIDHRYFPLLQQAFLSGRNFSEDDVYNQQPVMIVNETAAEILARNDSILDKTILINDSDAYKVIGVVKGYQRPGTDHIAPRVYTPANPANTQMMVKLKPGQTLSRIQIADVTRNISPGLALDEFQLLKHIRLEMLFVELTTAIISSCLVILTFFLATLGLYGILNYTTQLRRFELGTRMAIGAKGKTLIGLIMRNNSAAILSGLMISMIILVTLTIAFNTQLADYINLKLLPVSLLTLAIIAIISFAASYLPLRPIIKRPVIDSLRHAE